MGCTHHACTSRTAVHRSHLAAPSTVTVNRKIRRPNRKQQNHGTLVRRADWPLLSVAPVIVGVRWVGIVDAAVTAEGPDAADQLRSLHDWLADVEELRGRVSRRESPPVPGTLGPVLDALAVALGPGGAATAFAAAAISWLRNRHGEVRIKVTLADDRVVELTAKRVSGLDATALERQVAEVATMLSQGENEAHGTERP
jgi:hypothetical protein